MKTSNYIISNANQAVASIAYKTNEVMPIYPITPASEMSELAEHRITSYNVCYTKLLRDAGVIG